MAEKSESSQPVVDCNQNHASACKSFTVKLNFRAKPVEESAAMDIKRNRQFFTGRNCRRPDIQIQAILIHLRHKFRVFIKLFGIIDSVSITRGLLYCLPCPVRKNIRLANAAPACRTFRPFPAQLADRRFGIGNAEKGRITLPLYTFQQAILCLNCQHEDTPLL